MIEKKILTAEEMLPLITRGAREKKAADILVLDMRGLSSVADYFFICSAANPRQIKAISEQIRENLKQAGCRPVRTEGLSDSRWVVMDYFIILVHIFLEELRDYYSLRSLWGDAERLIPDQSDDDSGDQKTDS